MKAKQTRNLANELHIGQPNPECACCRKPFTKSIERRGRARIQPVEGLNIYIEYDLCFNCLKLSGRSGKSLKRVDRRVMAYHFGNSAENDAQIV